MTRSLYQDPEQWGGQPGGQPGGHGWLVVLDDGTVVVLDAGTVVVVVTIVLVVDGTVVVTIVLVVDGIVVAGRVVVVIEGDGVVTGSELVVVVAGTSLDEEAVAGKVVVLGGGSPGRAADAPGSPPATANDEVAKSPVGNQ